MSEPSLPRIVSPDIERGERIPPRQVLTRKWPVLHAGSTPMFDRAHWTFHIWGLVEQPWQCSYDEFLALPRVQVLADMHCVTRWSKLDNVWEGVSTREVLGHVKVQPAARFVMVHCEHGFTTNLPLDDFLGPDCLFAWKSAKWVRGIEFMERDRAGFWEAWEHGGYHMRGDPWQEERFRDP
jgi:DMSO/TMAO reductase YedYZ molybdopterin-dependent catalytic subunit